jgi:predicted O-methyltransferase YrrM
MGAAAQLALRRPGGLLREAARLPFERQARERIGALPLVELPDLTGHTEAMTVRLPHSSTRHPWSLGAAEQIVLQALIETRQVKTVFEIGTFNGGTTRLLAEAVPEDGVVWTLDLPQAAFDATQSPREFSGSEIGVAYRDSPAADRIVQLYNDSRSFDFTPYSSSADLVLVDGGHDYDHGYADTLAALSMLRADGLVLWDDFEPYWHGLVNGVCDAMAGRPLGRLAGTSLAVHDASRR